VKHTDKRLRAKDMLFWLACHTACFARLGGVPATVRVDNEKTAISRGAGVWGTVNPGALLGSPIAPRSPHGESRKVPATSEGWRRDSFAEGPRNRKTGPTGSCDMTLFRGSSLVSQRAPANRNALLGLLFGRVCARGFVALTAVGQNPARSAARIRRRDRRVC
jgi:hypothetical protein